MSRVITSPSGKWPGTVTISDPMLMHQVEAFEAGLRLPAQVEPDGKVYYTVLDKNEIPAILACVEKWELQNFPEAPTAENWPLSPRKASHALIEWLFDEIRAVYLGEAEVPNE